MDAELSRLCSVTLLLGTVVTRAGSSKITPSGAVQASMIPMRSRDEASLWQGERE